MGKSPMAYHGHERSRHHNYSRNSQSRNRRPENQGFAPANYIYTPDRFLRQLPSYRRGSQQRGPGTSQQYLTGRSFHNRPYSTARVRSPLIQKRLPPQRKRTRRDMHPPGDSEAATKSREQSTDAIKNENEPSSEGQHTEEDHSSNAVQASVPQTRSSTKAQQNKSDENIGSNKGEAEDGKGMSQSSTPQTRSSAKVRSKSEEMIVPDKSENEDGDNKIIRTTRGNSKVRNDDKSSSTEAAHLTEERVTGHNTRSATKLKPDVSDEPEQQEEGGNISKTRKVKKDTKTTVPDTEGDTESVNRQETEVLSSVDTVKKTHTQDHLEDSCQVSEDLTSDAALETDQQEKETVKSEELVTRNDKEASTVLQNVKHIVGNKSPRLILSQIDKHLEPSPEKGTNTFAASSDIGEIKDSPRRSSRRGTSRVKIDKEEIQLPCRTPHRDHSRTPIHIQQPAEQRETGDSFAASIRSISCRRSIRDSPYVSKINDSFQKQRITKQQVTVKKTTKEYLSDSKLDVSTEKSIDVTTESDESYVSRDKIGKRKASTLETAEKDQDHKKKCTVKSEQSSSVISAVSSPLQLLTQKPEPVSSSTPLKVVECCETVHMELSEESITDESVAYEKAQDNISEQSLSFEKGAPVPEPICEPVSRKWCSIM
ncbi:uncharacterized protein LOC126475208 isoform X1 [Schistocerca serialis cubense]|uniref:uncharacterized protein LOC126475208 isoform X1 n=2 Tax=Schistocerca serialis cubense TaxID=2023355 RepID=UPI00214EF85F|nr:uncharacterized protein LOC126475208 isoform X1 [Schistocerca serialis cubense]